MKKKNTHLGSSLGDFLESEGIREEANVRAICKMLAQEWRECMEREAVSVAALARKIKTNRATVARLISPDNTSLTFRTAARLSDALGIHLHIVAEPKKTVSRGPEGTPKSPQRKNRRSCPRDARKRAEQARQSLLPAAA